MSYKLSQIILKTAKLEKVGPFLAQVFETEIGPHEKGAILKCDPEILLLSAKTAQVKGSICKFDFDSQEDFEFFFNKVQFLFYRQGESETKLAIEESDEERYFSIKNPEGREWLFSQKKV